MIRQNTTATVLITVRPQQSGLLINQATAGVDTTLTFDPVPDNNQFAKQVNVKP